MVFVPNCGYSISSQKYKCSAGRVNIQYLVQLSISSLPQGIQFPSFRYNKILLQCPKLLFDFTLEMLKIGLSACPVKFRISPQHIFLSEVEIKIGEADISLAISIHVLEVRMK